MKPGKARKDRPKGPKSFSRGGSKKVERSTSARPAKRDDRSDDRRSEKREERRPEKRTDRRPEKRSDRRPEKRTDRRPEKRDDRIVFKKPVRVNDREMKREDRRPDRPEKRFDRRQSAQDAVAGKNSVVEALRAKVPAKELVVAIKVEIDEKISEAIRLAKNSDLPIKELPRRALDDLTGSANHQGIALVIKPFNYTEFDKLISNAKKPMMLIGLDGITDPHNLGAVVRSAAAFGADGVVIPERRNASMTGSAWKASAGAAARMPISQVTNLVRSIEDAKKAGCFVIGLDAEGDATLAKMNLATESIFIIVGSEGKGLSRLVRDKCDLVVSIPMQSTVESLNASVATAIVMYQVAAERSK
ncbi:MAG: 23S rRNA (guanosine(2251)-2'-O)-methyltransferase RlmB [Actinobacteria bacterium]|nr:23S rRNA (guanosine(2251)-2'-O)-methyltransferase RlmB [Actinomycetota bacterium]